MHLGGVRAAFQAEGTTQATVRQGMALSGVSRWSLVCTLGGIREGTKPGDGLMLCVSLHRPCKVACAAFW